MFKFAASPASENYLDHSYLLNILNRNPVLSSLEGFKIEAKKRVELSVQRTSNTPTDVELRKVVKNFDNITIDGDGNVGSENDKSDDDEETIRIESGDEEGNGNQ
nr:1676_t:CDS:2 [Entrophospora candida]